MSLHQLVPREGQGGAWSGKRHRLGKSPSPRTTRAGGSPSDRHGDSASGAVCKRQAGAPATLKVRRRRDSKEVASRTVYMYRPEGDPRAARDALGQVLRKLNLLQAEKMGGGAESSYLYGGSFVQVNA